MQNTTHTLPSIEEALKSPMDYKLIVSALGYTLSRAGEELALVIEPEQADLFMAQIRKAWVETEEQHYEAWLT